MFRPARSVRFTSPFALDEAVARLKERDEQEVDDLAAFIGRRIGIRFEVEMIDAHRAGFTQFKQRLSVQNPYHTIKTGGVSVVGTLSRGENRTTSVIAASHINALHAIISSGNLILMSGLLIFFIPAALLQVFEYAPVVALLVGGLLCVGTVLGWLYLINRIVDDLFNILRWTLHGYGTAGD